jgi:hypothetical protein
MRRSARALSAAVLAGAALALAVPTASAGPGVSVEWPVPAESDVSARSDASEMSARPDVTESDATAGQDGSAESDDSTQVDGAAEADGFREPNGSAELDESGELDGAADVDGSVGSEVSGESAAEVSPSSVPPGADVTVSVSCAPTSGSPPDTIDATSQAFDSGAAPLRLVAGNDGNASGPAYSGTAHIAADAVGSDSAWTVDGACPAAPGGKGKHWSAKFTVDPGSGSTPCTESHGSSCATNRPCTEPHTDSCGGAVVPRGVHAGEGGSFTDSAPALVAGGLLIAGALGAAVHRLYGRRREPAADN